MEIITKYFPDLSDIQHQQFAQLKTLYSEWNAKINVISRKDIDNIYQNHVLHSLSLAKYYPFKPYQNIADVGTGGGFPGLPLAILYPETSFTLIDSILKKLKVINNICEILNINNCSTVHSRIEDLPQSFDVIISRAVTSFPVFVEWCYKKINKGENNGILYLKGGDLSIELQKYKRLIHTTPISVYFNEPFFETKKIVFYPKK